MRRREKGRRQGRAPARRRARARGHAQAHRSLPASSIMAVRRRSSMGRLLLASMGKEAMMWELMVDGGHKE